MKTIRIHPSNNVAVALTDIAAGEEIGLENVIAAEAVKRGHKIALKDISAGDQIIKYGNPIAGATADIKKGSWVHTHNAKTLLKEGGEYVYDHKTYSLPKVSPKTFMGYRRKDGRWYARYRKTERSDGKAGYGYVYGQTKEEVEQRLREMRN